MATHDLERGESSKNADADFANVPGTSNTVSTTAVDSEYNSASHPASTPSVTSQATRASTTAKLAPDSSSQSSSRVGFGSLDESDDTWDGDLSSPKRQDYYLREIGTNPSQQLDVDGKAPGRPAADLFLDAAEDARPDPPYQPPTPGTPPLQMSKWYDKAIAFLAGKYRFTKARRPPKKVLLFLLCSVALAGLITAIVGVRFAQGRPPGMKQVTYIVFAVLLGLSVWGYMLARGTRTADATAIMVGLMVGEGLFWNIVFV